MLTDCHAYERAERVLLVSRVGHARTGDTWVNLGSNIHAQNAHTRTGHERNTRRPRAVASEHTNDGGALRGTGTFPPRGKLVARTCPARLLRVQWRIEEGIKAFIICFFSSALCYCTAELLSSRGRSSSVVSRPSVIRKTRFLRIRQAD